MQLRVRVAVEWAANSWWGVPNWPVLICNQSVTFHVTLCSRPLWITSYLQPKWWHYLAVSYRNFKTSCFAKPLWQFVYEMSSLYERCYSCGRVTGGSLFYSSYCHSISTDPSCSGTFYCDPYATSYSSEGSSRGADFHFEKQSRHGNKSYDPTKSATRQSGCGSIPCDIQTNLNDYTSSFNPRSHHSVLDIPSKKKCSDTSLESLSP